MSTDLPGDAEPTLPLFFFGTLMDPEILGLVIGRRVPPEELEPAVLEGFRRVRVREASYPMLVPDPSGRVEGVLWRKASARDRMRLDAYEGAGYRREPLEVATATGERVRAEVYLAVPGRLSPSEEGWDLASWQARFKSSYLHLGDRLWRSDPP